MLSSTFLTLFGATLAVASPVAHDRVHKKAIIYDIDTEIVYVTVTAGFEPAAAPTTVQVTNTVVVTPEPETTYHHVHSKKPKTSSTSIAPPPPAPTTEAPAPTTEAPAPSSEAPAPTTEAQMTEAAVPTTEAPAPAPSTTEAAPVVAVTPTTEAPVTAPTPESAKAVAPAASTSTDPLAGTGIDKHNTCRASHSASDVTWNATLADAASKLANTCVWGHDLTIDGGGYGQNIAAQGSSSSTAWTLESALENAIIEEWYSEASLFAPLYGQEAPQPVSGGDFTHFTQIVWKNSVEIGCAVAACPTSSSIFPGMYTWYTVCNYYPQGNVEGEFAQNVLSS